MYLTERILNENWRLYISENRICKDFAEEITDELSLKSHGISSIPATVPGNFELDMQKAGLIEDPFYGKNPLDIQKYENRHLWYSVRFDYTGNEPKRAYLIFDGIDTFSDIYLNGNIIGSTDNMFIAYEFAAKGIKNGANELLVHIKPTVIEARRFNFDMDVLTHQKYNAAALSVRKAAHSFGWDIMPRFVSGGLWRNCRLVEKKSDYIEDIYLSTSEISDNKAYICGNFSTVIGGDYSTEYSLDIKGECKESKFSVYFNKLWHNNGAFTFTVENPSLWWLRDMGKQNLYKVTATLYHGEEIVDTTEFNFGIRTVKLEKSDTTDSGGSGEFCFYVNGVRAYIRGTNWVPLDAFHSRDGERLKKALDMLVDVNCNAVRCWGGNVYEDHEFFDFCDKNGVLVWQDFAMGCATYPQNREFLEKMREETEFIVKKLRRHASLALWAGDNECDEASAYWLDKNVSRDPNKNRITREIIPEVLKRLDPYREYLPSSPYVSEKAWLNGNRDGLPENHLWGPRDYYKGEFYTKASPHFASEIGYHGCPSAESIKRFISPEKLWPWQGNDEWQVHAACMETDSECPYDYRIALMAGQVKTLFGEDFDDLETFSLASQLSQAEAVKFFIENFRTQKWRRTGLIWWNLIDGWPQFSDAVVDYFYNKKIAYSFIKRSQEPVALMVKEPKDGFLVLTAVNEFLKDISIKYKVTDLTEQAVITEAEADVSSNGISELHKIPFDGDNCRFYVLEWEYGGEKYKNHYISGSAPYNYDKYVAWLREAELI